MLPGVFFMGGGFWVGCVGGFARGCGSVECVDYVLQMMTLMLVVGRC